MPTAQAVIDTILAGIGVPTLRETVDVVVAGDSSREVTGIVTTFLASHDVLRQAAAAGANLIISHEPVFYNHYNRMDWLADDAVYHAKRQFADDHGLVVWRLHDYWHRRQPDGVLIGMLKALAWLDYSDPAEPARLALPPTPLGELVAHIEAKLGAKRALVIGAPNELCSKAALLVGAQGAERHIMALRGDIDLLIAGEVNEWETPEYVRDARAQGFAKALIVTGHFASEDAGMAYLAAWLRPLLPGVPVTHIASGDPFAR